LSDRRSRANAFKTRTGVTDLSAARSGRLVNMEASSYLGRERAHLRKRRTKLRLASFHIITQVGQGGYGEVFLARKRETGEVCALKRLRKKVLVRMDEVSLTPDVLQ
jgi:cell cycle protein kinase DBF2